MNRSSEIAYCVYPCPCGYAGDPTKECACSPSTVTRYQKRTSEAGLRVSGPLLDRIDIHIEVPRVPALREKLTGERLGESSSVVAARDRQQKRFAGQNSHIVCNADMTPADVRVFCKLDATGQSLMRSAMQQLQLSARAFPRVLKIARTIADLAGSEEIAPAHPSLAPAWLGRSGQVLAEAIHLRQAEKAGVMALRLSASDQVSHHH